jgi:hypothetical protein
MQKYKTLEEFFNDLDDEKHLQVETLRKLILEIGPQLEERIKWNAPSYALEGDDRITFNLMNKQGVVKLVLHMGTARKENKKGDPVMEDESGLIEWSSDIRGILTFADVEDIKVKSAQLKTILEKWLLIPAKN